MAEEGFEHYHVPQQSRRNKLRVFPEHQPYCFVESSSTCPTLASLYDPSLIIPSDLLACATQQGGGGAAAKEQEGSNLMMGFVKGAVVNGDAIQVIINNNNPLYQLQNLREYGDTYNDGSEMMVFKPEPLSLSLSSHSNSTHHYPLELNLQRYGAVNPGLVGGNSEVSRNSVPLGPFTGYASILKGSRFLKPAQQLLEELCDVGGVCAEKIVADASLMEPIPPESSSEDPLGDHGGDQGRKKSRLLTMLDEVCALVFVFVLISSLFGLCYCHMKILVKGVFLICSCLMLDAPVDLNASHFVQFCYCF